MAKRRKYKFADRGQAEDKFESADRRRLIAEWFASALLTGRVNHVGHVDVEGNWTTHVGYFTVRYSAIVFAYRLSSDERRVHCIRDLADIDNMGQLIRDCLRHEPTRRYGELLDKARIKAEHALLNS
jgi:hypothetical protein